MDVKIMRIRTFCESLSPIFMLMRKHIICYSFDKRTYIRDLKSGKIFRNIATKYWHSYRIDISPDCKILAISDYLGSETYFFNIQNGNIIPLNLQNQARVTAMHFTPDSKYLITGCDNLTLQVNNVQQGNQVIGPVMSHDDTIVQISISMDQEQIISISEDGIMRKWSFQTHKQLGEDVLLFNRTGAVKCTYDGQYIALVEHYDIIVRDVELQNTTRDCLAFVEKIIAIVPQIKVIITISISGKLRFWCFDQAVGVVTNNSNCYQIFNYDNTFISAALSKDKKYLLTTRRFDKKIQISMPIIQIKQ